MKKSLLIIFILIAFCSFSIKAQITTFPYVEDFETGPGGWVANNTSLGTWALGTPIAPIINSAASGTNAWVTNLFGLYNNSENSWVESPIFNFTSVPNPAIDVKIWWNAEFSWDGMVLQSSIDNGLTWQNVGLQGDPGWYNDNSINGNPGGQQTGWTGRISSSNGSGGWVTAFHLLNGLGGQASVKLRFAFGADGSVNDEGVAFDLITIANLSCNAPSLLNVSSVTSTSVDAGWTTNSTATSFQVQYGLQGFTLGSGTNIFSSTNPTPITGLLPNTQYSFYVRNICGPADTSFWAGPFNFQTLCATSLAGTFTIGATGTYPNFTAAVADLLCGISGPVVFNVLPGSGPYNEQIEIPQIINSSSTNTITFNGNGETITFSTLPSPNNYIIRLNGADYITFNNLNITTIAVTNNFAVHLTNNADFNTFNGCKIDLSSTLGSTSALNAGIVLSGSLTSATALGASGNNNTFTNDTIIGGYYAITLVGTSAAVRTTGNVVSNNDIQDFYFYGIYHSQANNTQVLNNSISRPIRSTLSSFYGIYYTGGGENNLAEANTLFNAFGGNVSSTSVAYPIYHTGVDATVGNENKVINNLIYDINHNGTICGMYNSSSDGVFYYHNTISLDNTAATAGLTRGFYQLTTASGIDFRNNIITISRGGTGNKHCIYMGSTTTTLRSNNNVFLMNAAGGTNGIGWYSTNQATLTDWQLVNGAVYDANSVDADPLFINVAANNFTPSSPLVDGIADATVGVATDIFGTTRAVTPDPGAIEFVPLSCPQPSNLTAINVTSISADLLWIETGSATTWQLDWDTAGVAQGFGNLLLTTTNPHSLMGLSPQSDYRYYVRSICAVGDTSFWAGPYTLTTLCAPFNAPWLDNVEAHATTTNSTIENCWSSSPTNTTSAYRWDIDGAGGTPSGSTGPSGAFSGNNYFYTEASSGSVGDVAELYSPLIDVTALTLPELSFYYHMYGQTMGDLYIDVFDGVNWITTDSIKGEQQTADTDPWLEHKIVLNNFPDTIQVRFRSIRSTNFYGDMALDDIEIAEAPTCPQPIALNVSNLTMNSAALGWTEVGAATNWQVEWGISGFTLGGGVRLMTTTNPHIQFGLQAAVTYDFYVRSVCAIGDSSLWTGPYTFTTPICNPSQQCSYTFRMTDSFGDGWNGNTMDIIQNGITVATIGSTFTTGNGPIDITVPLCSTFPFSLYWNTGGSFNTEVGIEIIDANNTSIFAHNPGIDLSGTTLFTDSVFCPSCPKPTNVTATIITTTSADISWSSFIATSWQVEWDTTGFVQGNGNISITTNNPFNISGLVPSGMYDFYVRSICAPGDSSVWSGPFTFTTECTIITSLPYFQDFETGKGCWQENNTTNGTWGFGTPAMTVINSAASGVNAFATGNLNGLYNANENSWVLSPRFDFTNVNNPKIEVKVWWNAEFSWDGMVLQSSIDNGASWQNVGAFGDPDNWYTDNTINGNPGGQQEGWSGRISSSNGSNGWVLASHLLTGLNNQPSVKLRFAFGSDGSVQDDGVAFDDVHIFDVCVDPTNLTATNITTTSANLAWTENGPATVWNVEWGAAGFTLGTGTLIASTTNNPESITGLTAATAYEFYVQSDCSQDSSAWVGPFQFITACAMNNLGTDTTICSVNALTLDAGTGFSTYSWSNGSSSQTIVVDSTNFGLGIHTIYVDVTDTISGCTATDTIVVEITTCVGVKENTATIAMNVYPNPSKGQFAINLTTTNTTDLQIRITNVQGQEVFIKNNFDNINVINENINIGNVKGVYFVNIITNNEVITKKIIIQ